jgi:hypothetical protein
MKPGLRNLYLPIVILLVLSSVIVGCTPTLAQTSYASASATPSDSAPNIGEQIQVDINIDVSGVEAPDDALGSFTGTLHWDPAVLAYNSYTGAPPTGFTGNINTEDAASGQILYNGANASGVTGKITILHITFEVVGGGPGALDLGFTSMADAGTYANLLPVLTIQDGAVEVPAASAGVNNSIGDTGNPMTLFSLGKA